MKKYVLDTNVVLRFLRKDDDFQSPAAATLFAEADAGKCLLLLSRDVIAETVWVMQSKRYATERHKVAEYLIKLVSPPSVECENKPAVLNGITRFASSDLDIVDCLLAGVAVDGGDVLATFDKGIGKAFDDVELWNHKAEQRG